MTDRGVLTGEMGAADAWSVEGLSLMEVAHVVTKLKMYPYFDVANYVLMCSMVREDSQAASSASAQGSGRNTGRHLAHGRSYLNFILL